MAWVRGQLARWEDLEPLERKRLAAMLVAIAEVDAGQPEGMRI